jgi:hypothetical protein
VGGAYLVARAMKIPLDRILFIKTMVENSIIAYFVF